MEPDRDDLPAEQAGLREARTWAAQPRESQVRGAQPRDAQLREAQLREAWCRRSLATGWRTPDDWHNAAVDEVLSGCRNRAPAPGEAGLAAVGDGDLTAACAGLGRARAPAGYLVGSRP